MRIYGAHPPLKVPTCTGGKVGAPRSNTIASTSERHAAARPRAPTHRYSKLAVAATLSLMVPSAVRTRATCGHMPQHRQLPQGEGGWVRARDGGGAEGWVGLRAHRVPSGRPGRPRSPRRAGPDPAAWLWQATVRSRMSAPKEARPRRAFWPVRYGAASSADVRCAIADASSASCDGSIVSSTWSSVSSTCDHRERSAFSR